MHTCNQEKASPCSGFPGKCSAKGRGSAVGAATSSAVKQQGLEQELLRSLGGAGQGWFRAQQFSPLRHQAIDSLPALLFIRCKGARAGSSPGPWEIQGAGKVPCARKSKSVLEMGNGAGDGDAGRLGPPALPLAQVLPGHSEPGSALNDDSAPFFFRDVKIHMRHQAAHSSVPSPTSPPLSKPHF